MSASSSDRSAQRTLRQLARVDVSMTPAAEALAEAIAGRGFRAMDALHVASATAAGEAWLLTSDLGRIRKMRGDHRIVVADPSDASDTGKGITMKTESEVNRDVRV